VFRSITEKMKKAAKFLKYPVLQYIPVSFRTVGQRKGYADARPGARLVLYRDRAAFLQALQQAGLVPQAALQAGELYAICYNFTAELILFRYLTCKIIGREDQGAIHAFSCTKKYFPRRRLHFALYTDGGRKLYSLNAEIY